MLEFYEFNTFNICVVLISTFVIYYLLCNFFNDKDKNGNGSNESNESNESNQSNGSNGNELNFEYLLISVLISICISIGTSYFMSAGDEAILTENFWENNQFE